MTDLDPSLATWLALSEIPLQARLDVADVYSGIRSAARVLLPLAPSPEGVVVALLKMPLSVAVARGVKWQQKRTKLGFVDWATRRDDQAEAFVVLYVASTQANAEELRKLDELGCDADFGAALGYPTCCVEWVVGRGGVPALAESFELYAMDGSYTPRAWPPSMVCDAPLMPHFPCSRNCNASGQIAAHRWRLLLASHNTPLIERVRGAFRQTYFLSGSREISIAAPSKSGEDVLLSARPLSGEQLEVLLG